jgi:tetratricopeptide (TPR) repeat protein
MNELIIDKPMGIDVLDESLYSYSDSDLSLLFLEQSQNILKERVLEMIKKSPAFVKFLESLKMVEVFDVNMSKTAKEMYESGKWTLKYSKTKDGLIPTLSDESGKFVEQVTLNPKDIAPNLSDALTNLSLQQQLGQLMEQMKTLNNSIERIEIGQRDDRLGLYYSARQQYIEAISMSNETLQSHALLNTVNTANNANHQLMQSMRSEIEQIVRNKKLKKNERDKLSTNVRNTLRYINETTELCVISYVALGENKSMLASLKSYQCFIKQTFLNEREDKLKTYQKLHQNWNGTDNEWLQIPEQIVDRIDKQILVHTGSPVLLEG